MKLLSVGWVLLIFWSGLGLVKHGGDEPYETKQECENAWHGYVECYKSIAKHRQPDGVMEWGQPIGMCFQGDVLTAPGLILPEANVRGCQ